MLGIFDHSQGTSLPSRRGAGMVFVTWESLTRSWESLTNLVFSDRELGIFDRMLVFFDRELGKIDHYVGFLRPDVGNVRLTHNVTNCFSESSVFFKY